MTDALSIACQEQDHRHCMGNARDEEQNLVMCVCSCHLPNLEQCGTGMVTVRCCNGCGETATIYTEVPLTMDSLPEPWRVVIVVNLVGGGNRQSFPVSSAVCAEEWIAKNGWRYIQE